jgi:hypothetical protein
MSFDTISTLIALHSKSNGYFSLFLENYKLNQDLELFSNSLKLPFPTHVAFIGKWSFWDGL